MAENNEPVKAVVSVCDNEDILLGRRIRARRIVMGFTQQDVGDLFGITFQQVQKYERGYNRVSAVSLRHIAKMFGVSLGFFFDEEQDDQRKPLRKSITLMKDYNKCDARGQDVVETIARKLANED